VRTVDIAEQPFVSGIQRWKHEIGSHQGVPDLAVPEQRTVGKDGDRNVRQALDLRDQIADAGIQRRLPGTGKTDIIGFIPLGQFPFHFLKDVLDRNVFFPFDSLICCAPQLAIDAVVGAGLERHEVDPERPSEAPRRNGTVHMLKTAGTHERPPHCGFPQRSAAPPIGRRTLPLHPGHFAMASSGMACRRSNLRRHVSHSYSWVGMPQIPPASSSLKIPSARVRKSPRYSGNASTIRNPFE